MYCFFLLVINGAWIDPPLRRWKSWSFVSDTSNFSFHSPLKYSALDKISLVMLFTASRGRISLIRPFVSILAHWLTWSATSAALINFQDKQVMIELAHICFSQYFFLKYSQQRVIAVINRSQYKEGVSKIRSWLFYMLVKQWFGIRQCTSEANLSLSN